MATEKPANSDDVSSDNEKTAKVAEKLKTLGVTGSGKKAPEKKSHTIMSMMMVLIIAIPAGLIAAYVAMPDQLNELFSFASSTDNQSSSSFDARSQMPVHPAAGNRVHAQEPEWVAQRRAEMEKRRSEFEKQNADKSSSNMNQSEQPQWYKDRQAEMEKRRSEFEKQKADNFTANMNPSEPPQWVKDRQDKMEQERARYQEQRTKQLANMANNRMPGYMNHPGMQAPQMAATVPNNQVPVWQNQNRANVYPQGPVPYYNGYAQRVNPNPYYNAPYYPNGPYGAPYGYPYR